DRDRAASNSPPRRCNELHRTCIRPSTYSISRRLVTEHSRNEGGGKEVALYQRDIGSVFLLHADEVIAGIDVMHLAGDAAGQIAAQVKGRPAHVFDCDVAAQRRIQLVPLEDIAEVADSAGCEGLDRPGANRVYADVLGPEI